MSIDEQGPTGGARGVATRGSDSSPSAEESRPLSAPSPLSSTSSNGPPRQASTSARPADATAVLEGGVLTLRLSGDWDLDRPAPRFAEVLSGTAPGTADAVAFESSGLGRWDSSLLSFLLQGMNHCEAEEIRFDEEGLPAGIGALLGLARAVPEKLADAGKARPAFPARLGARGVAFYDALLASVTFTGEVAHGVVRLLTFRGRMRWRDFWVVVQSNGSGALPIVTLISFLVGLIIAFLGAVVLRRFGAGYYVSYLVGYGMLREMAALMTGIIIAGRTGAAFAAEIGSMKISEEIDAFETLGMSPIDHLVMPRVLGLFVMMPLLTIYAMFVGILGGMVVAISFLDLTVVQFMTGLLTPVTLSDGLLGIFKGGVFGLLIGVTGCMRGLQTGNDAGAVGRSATSAVVTSITLLIVANAVIDWLAALMGV
jgi:phospholipid/cholesterol/gamma-HCH transport system permease protein